MSRRKASTNFIDRSRKLGNSAKLQKDIAERLSLYEKQRAPITPVDDDRKIELEVRKLNVELTCPVCLGIIRETMTVMECLHRFCSECINKSLRWGKKECPTCRVHCSSRRHLRRDPNFDALIATIYPRLDEYEELEETAIQQINKSANNRKALQKSVEEGMRRQAEAAASMPRVSFKELKQSKSDLTSSGVLSSETMKRKIKTERMPKKSKKLRSLANSVSALEEPGETARVKKELAPKKRAAARVSGAKAEAGKRNLQSPPNHTKKKDKTKENDREPKEEELAHPEQVDFSKLAQVPALDLSLWGNMPHHHLPYSLSAEQLHLQNVAAHSGGSIGLVIEGQHNTKENKPARRPQPYQNIITVLLRPANGSIHNNSRKPNDGHWGRHHRHHHHHPDMSDITKQRKKPSENNTRHHSNEETHRTKRKKEMRSTHTLPPLEKPHLRMPKTLTIGQLCQYLEKCIPRPSPPGTEKVEERRAKRNTRQTARKSDKSKAPVPALPTTKTTGSDAHTGQEGPHHTETNKDRQGRSKNRSCYIIWVAPRCSNAAGRAFPRRVALPEHLTLDEVDHDYFGNFGYLYLWYSLYQNPHEDRSTWNSAARKRKNHRRLTPPIARSPPETQRRHPQYKQHARHTEPATRNSSMQPPLRMSADAPRISHRHSAPIAEQSPEYVFATGPGSFISVLPPDRETRPRQRVISPSKSMGLPFPTTASAARKYHFYPYPHNMNNNTPPAHMMNLGLFTHEPLPPHRGAAGGRRQRRQRRVSPPAALPYRRNNRPAGSHHDGPPLPPRWSPPPHRHTTPPLGEAQLHRRRFTARRSFRSSPSTQIPRRATGGNAHHQYSPPRTRSASGTQKRVTSQTPTRLRPRHYQRRNPREK